MEKININNSRNQEDVQTSKGKRKSKRELPSLPVPKDTAGHIQEHVDVSKSEFALETDDVTDRKEVKPKSKKGKSKGATEAQVESQAEDAEDRLLHEYQQQIAKEEEKTLKKSKVTTEEESVVSQNITLNNDIGKKKKKKLKSVITQPEEGCVYCVY